MISTRIMRALVIALGFLLAILLSAQAIAFGDVSEIPDFSHHIPPLELSNADLGLNSTARLILIGDIHGMHFSLLRLLKRAHYNPQADILVPTGDMLTKGGVDGSLEVLEFLRTQNKKNGNSVRAVRGNQDQPVVEWRGWIEWIEQLDEHGRPVPVDRTQATGQQTQTQTQTQMPEPGPEPTLATSLLDLDHAFFRVLFRYLPDNLNRLLGYYLEHHYVSPSGRSMRRDPHTNSKTGTGTSAATTQHHLKKDLTGAQWLAALDAYHKAHPPLSSEPRAIRHFLKRLRHANPSRFWKLLPPHLTKHGNLNLVEDSWNEHMETTEDSLYGTFVECNTRDRNEDEDNDKGKNTKVSMLDPNTNTESASTLDKNANHDIAEPDLSLTLFSEPYLIARRMSSADFAWLRDIPTALHLPDLHAFVVHAGLVPYDPTKPRRAVGQPLAFVPALSEDQKHERSHGVHIRAESGEDALDFVEPAPPPLVKGLRHKHQKPPTRAMPAVPPVGAEDHSNQDVSGTDPDQPHRLVVESTQMRTMKSTKTTTNLLRLAQERLLLSSHASGPKHDQHIGIPQNLSPWTHMNLRSVRRNGGLSGKAREGRYWAKVWNGEMGRCGGYPGYSKAFGHGTSGLGGLKGLGTFAEELGGLDGLVDREKEEEDASRGESSMEGDEDEEDIEDEKEDEKTDDEGNGEHTDGKKKNRKKKRRNMPCIPSTVIYGHTASFGLDLRRWTKGLDSGCAYGRRLSALILDVHSLDMSVKDRTRKHRAAFGHRDVGGTMDRGAQQLLSAQFIDVYDDDEADDEHFGSTVVAKNEWVRFAEHGSARIVQIGCPQVVDGPGKP